MSLLVTWLVLALLRVTSAQNATSDQSLNQAQNPTHETPDHDTIETATSAPGHEHEPHLHSPNEHRDERPHLKFNPPDLIPFPKQGQVAQFWRDHPDLKAIPDLPPRDTEYPRWLLKTMGRIHPTTPAPNPIENDQVLLSQDRRPLQQPEVRPLDSRTSESESENFIPEILPRRNDMKGRFESNNIPDQRETGNTGFPLPPEIPIQQSLQNSRMQQLRPSPNIQRPTERRIIRDFPPYPNGPILFRIPLNGLRRIPHVKSRNTQRNPNNFVILRDNRFENRPFSNTPVQMLPFQRRNFRGIPVTVSRPSMMHRPGILMLPVRNQNMPSRFSPPNFIQSHPSRMSSARERFMLGPYQNRPQNPSFVRPNEMPVDPQFSRESWQDEDSQRKPTLENQRQDVVMPEKQANTSQKPMIQPNGSSSFPRRSGIGARNKRQSGFESFDPFGMGNIFSFFPSGKEEPQNSFNWFPREPIMTSPTQQPPVSSGVFNPNAKQRPVNPPPKQHITSPQDAWMILPPSSSNGAPNFQVQNPHTNHGSSNRQIPEDFMIIRPNKAPQQKGGSNKMPWMLNSLFGADPFAENNGNQMWTFPFDDDSGTDNNQPPHTNRGQQFHDQPPEFQPSQNFHPSRGENQHSDFDDNIQRPSNHFPPPVNRNNINRGNNQPQDDWRPAHQRPVQPQQPTVPQPHDNWSPTHQRPAQPQRPTVPQPHGNWRPAHQRPAQPQQPAVPQPHENWRPAHQRRGQPQQPTVPQPHENWRPAHQRPSSQRPALPQLPAVPHGKWIPRESTHKKAPVSRSNHFHEMPSPHHQHPHHHHPEHQPARPTEVPTNHKDRHQPHRRPTQPEIQKGKRKLSPSEVRHLLSLLPEFPKEIHKKPIHGNPKSQTVGLTVNGTGKRQKRSVYDPIFESADIVDGNLTRNYPGSNQIPLPDLTKRSNSSKVPFSSRNSQSPKDRRKRDIEESLVQDVTYGSYGYHSGYNYQDNSESDYSSPFFGSHNLDSGIGDLWGNMFPKKSHNLFNGAWDWPNHGYYRPHLGFGHFPHGHAAGHYHPHLHPHPHHNNYWHGNVWPQDQGRFPGDRRVVAIPPAVPRANPNQLSYTARFRYRFGIYPGYSDYIPGADDHEIFFFYDAKQDRTPDALIPFRSY